MTDWITHEGNEPPLLAPAVLVVILAEERRGFITPTGPWRADNVTWRSGLEYRPLTNDKGHKLISAEGLEPWARWVATDHKGYALQFSAKPLLHWWRGQDHWSVTGADMMGFAPDSHRHPGDCRDSLYRVEGR